MKDFKAFTLAEVLITIGIVGVVAVLTLNTVIKDIQHRQYIEAIKKRYAEIQNITAKIIEEEGEPSNWILDAYSLKSNESNDKVANLYAQNLKIIQNCGTKSSYTGNTCITNDYKTLNSSSFNAIFSLNFFVYAFTLADGSTLIIKFRNNYGGGFLWGSPDMLFIVDVNGKKSPNTVGRDIFYFYLNANDKGKVYPYGYAQTDDCNKEGAGYTCAYKIITEGKMNY
jgi:prepilin-type N-terminal cleavage/methylation domain-containing protein